MRSDIKPSMFIVVSWLPVPLVYQVLGPRATTVNIGSTIPFLFMLCINIKRNVAICLCNGMLHKALSARLIKISYVALRRAIL